MGICDLSTITDTANLTTLVIMAYLNHDALMMVLSKYNDCRLFGGILHEIVRYRFTPLLSTSSRSVCSGPNSQMPNRMHSA